jgi:hypothetical protein
LLPLFFLSCAKAADGLSEGADLDHGLVLWVGP